MTTLRQHQAAILVRGGGALLGVYNNLGGQADPHFVADYIPDDLSRKAYADFMRHCAAEVLKQAYTTEQICLARVVSATHGTALYKAGVECLCDSHPTWPELPHNIVSANAWITYIQQCARIAADELLRVYP